MTLLRGFCAQTLLFTALLASTCFAGFFSPEKDRAARSKLRIRTEKQAAVNSYGPPACTPGTPQLPNYIQPMKVDPTRMMGKWYSYMEWFIGATGTLESVNVVTTFTNLLNESLTLYPGSNTKALALEQLYGSLNATTNQCNTVTQAYLDYLTVDGQQRGIGLTNGAEGDIDTSLVLATDYDAYAIFYECDKYNINTDLCVDPHPYVYTRERPDKISVTNANNVVSAINQALGAYCFTADMMKKFPWLNNMAECPLVAATDSCYISLRSAYLYLGDPNFSG